MIFKFKHLKVISGFSKCRVEISNTRGNVCLHEVLMTSSSLVFESLTFVQQKEKLELDFKQRTNMSCSSTSDRDPLVTWERI